MSDIIEALRSALAEQDAAKVLHIANEVVRQHDEGLIKVLPCKVGERISSEESIEEIIIDKAGIDVNIAESYSCDCGGGIRHRRERYMDKTINLCDTCQKCFADCDNGEEGKDFFFGVGLGNDNVYKCRAYKPREAAEKALKENKNGN